MKKEYFTPNVEDIHVEYECEILKEKWEHFVFNVEEIIPVFGRVNSKTVLSEKIRVPYLTKEQIEAEGWKEEQMYINGTFVMILGELNEGYELMFAEGNSQIVITKVWTLFDDQVKRDNIFKGNCKDINTFRKIIKLLEI